MDATNFISLINEAEESLNIFVEINFKEEKFNLLNKYLSDFYSPSFFD